MLPEGRLVPPPALGSNWAKAKIGVVMSATETADTMAFTFFIRHLLSIKFLFCEINQLSAEQRSDLINNNQCGKHDHYSQNRRSQNFLGRIDPLFVSISRQINHAADDH